MRNRRDNADLADAIFEPIAAGGLTAGVRDFHQRPVFAHAAENFVERDHGVGRPHAVFLERHEFDKTYDHAFFARITRVPDGYDNVLAGIRASRRAGLWPVKVNCVLMRGFNEDQIVPFGMFAREEDVVVRFIEFMPLEEDRVWSPNTVVPLEEILLRMAEYRPLVEIPHARSETARRYRFDDGVGEIGIIAPVSHPFCGHCSRIRITSDGKIRTCLFSVWDHDLHGRMRRGASDEELAEFIGGVIQKKEERHHIGEPDFVPASRTMVHIGG